MVERLEMPKVEQSDVEIFTPPQIKKLFDTCDRMKQPHRNRAVLHILLDTGIRASEICYDSTRPQEETGLRMDGLFLGRGTESYIWIMGKGRKSRTIGIGQQTALAMRKYLNRERGRVDSPYVFLSSHGDEEPLSVRMLQQFLDALGELAGVPDTHAHRFRHTFAVNHLLNGTSDLVLMRLLGHTTLDSTKIYTRAMSQYQARTSAISVVDSMRSKKK
jgi:site-specific recombinase XerD